MGFFSSKDKTRSGSGATGPAPLPAQPIQFQPPPQQPQPPVATPPGPGGSRQLSIAPVRGSSHPAGIFNMPPKKVVRANKSYTARFAGELSFEKGDFFYVINERPDGLSFEVINPIQRLRGIVPSAYFDSLDKIQQDAQAKAQQQQQLEGLGDYSYNPPPGEYDDYGYNNRGSGGAGGSYGAAADPYGGSYGGPVSGGSGGYGPGPGGYDGGQPGYDAGPMSPVSPAGPRERQLWSVLVQRAEQREDGQWWFTIELKMTDNTSNILFRTYDDFWVLQVSLLNHFPAESGRNDQARVIPFLPTPTRTMTPEQAQSRRNALDAYMQHLIKLPPHIMNSPSIKRFLMIRTGDLDTAINIRFDVSETLMDLLTDYEEDTDVRIKLVLGEEIIAWKEPDYVSFDELIMHAEERLEFRFQYLLYKDEVEQLIPLRGDLDLGLLITTYSKKLTFYVS
ncbi:SH3 and PX domain-containing protein 2B [Polyrhizophydium stewartii]|uniref:SH3 and PX domain-containing protein 2B n=1 Tax=Polyrhizophydium stewartii TaxID=2732419 RepID=A0ABR4N2T7_9FUNG